jgi:hypothetical protein
MRAVILFVRRLQLEFGDPKIKEGRTATNRWSLAGLAVWWTGAVRPGLGSWSVWGSIGWFCALFITEPINGRLPGMQKLLIIGSLEI